MQRVYRVGEPLWSEDWGERTGMTAERPFVGMSDEERRR